VKQGKARSAIRVREDDDSLVACLGERQVGIPVAIEIASGKRAQRGARHCELGDVQAACVAPVFLNRGSFTQRTLPDVWMPTDVAFAGVQGHEVWPPVEVDVRHEQLLGPRRSRHFEKPPQLAHFAHPIIRIDPQPVPVGRDEIEIPVGVQVSGLECEKAAGLDHERGSERTTAAVKKNVQRR
jgi:hypothetical protein